MMRTAQIQAQDYVGFDSTTWLLHTGASCTARVLCASITTGGGAKVHCDTDKTDTRAIILQKLEAIFGNATE
jgi:hypothetical protein